MKITLHVTVLIGYAFKAYFKAIRVKQEALAAQLKISVATLNGILNGRSSFDVMRLKLMVDTLVLMNTFTRAATPATVVDFLKEIDKTAKQLSAKHGIEVTYEETITRGVGAEMICVHTNVKNGKYVLETTNALKH